ncbi:MAG: hypothetical protein ACYSUQ_14225, partial [Planctomycetota bacterium]
MQKFFRKHMKKILAISMAFLLVAWLGGSALETLMTPDPRDTIVATSRYGDISSADRMQAEAVTDILSRMGFRWNLPVVYLGPQADRLTQFDWVLLTREAKQMGFGVTDEEAQEFVTTQGRTANDVYRVARRLERAPEQVYAAVGELRSVDKALGAVLGSVQVSEAEVRVAARNVFEKVKVQYVALKAEAFSDQAITYADAELEELFAEYREQERGKGMTFGYFLPARLKAQYLKVNLDKVVAGLRISERTLEREARSYWRE